MNRAKHTVLVVDDEEILLTMSETILSEFGYHVQTANSAQKALAMFNEMESQAAGQWGAGEVLDRYNDVVPFNPVLTTDKALDRPGGNPADPLSANRLTNGHWRYLRHVQVNPCRGNRRARQVVVRIWRCGSNARPEVGGALLATMAGIIGP